MIYLLAESHIKLYTKHKTYCHSLVNLDKESERETVVFVTIIFIARLFRSYYMVQCFRLFNNKMIIIDTDPIIMTANCEHLYFIFLEYQFLG